MAGAYSPKFFARTTDESGMAFECRKALVGWNYTVTMSTVVKSGTIMKVPDYKGMSLNEEAIVTIPKAFKSLPVSMGILSVPSGAPTFELDWDEERIGYHYPRL